MQASHVLVESKQSIFDAVGLIGMYDDEMLTIGLSDGVTNSWDGLIAEDSDMPVTPGWCCYEPTISQLTIMRGPHPRAKELIRSDTAQGYLIPYPNAVVLFARTAHRIR